MPYTYSEVATEALAIERRCIEDRREAPIRGRNTQFRLMQHNMLAYTFDTFIPGFSPLAVRNDAPFADINDKPLVNAHLEGAHFFGVDYRVSANAQAKVAGDIFEVLTHAIMWNSAARWNTYMTTGAWPGGTPRYARPACQPDPNLQVGVLNLPRGYDWVRLLTPEAQQAINEIRAALEGRHQLTLPTSTPDIAVVILPDAAERTNPLWCNALANLQHDQQHTLRDAYAAVEGRIEPGELILANAVKRSLRSDRLYQPLYEANVMQLLLEGFLGAPRVEFEVQTLSLEGTAAVEIYRAASLFGVATELQQLLDPYAAQAPDTVIHRAVRDLYIPANAQELAQRFLHFLDTRMTLV